MAGYVSKFGLTLTICVITLKNLQHPGEAPVDKIKIEALGASPSQPSPPH